MKIFNYMFFLMVFLGCVCVESHGNTSTVTLPLSIDYPLLRELLVHNAFPEEGERTTLVNEGNGCVALEVARPQLSEREGLVRLEVQVKAAVGTPVGGRCLGSLGWQGFLVLYQQPNLKPDSWQLSFSTISSEVLDRNRQPAKIATILWNMIEPRVTGYLAGINIDLMPPVRDVKNFLLPIFPAERKQQTEKMLTSMYPAKIEVLRDSLSLGINAEVETIFNPDKMSSGQQLDEETLQQTVSMWEKWDGLLVYMVTILAREMLSDDEKRALINVLLDTRYRFVNEMAENSLQRDIVREQFVNGWQVMGPIFKKHLLQGKELGRALGYLAFVSSADALLVFDNLGPTLGIEISTTGLVRLMKMLNADPEILKYNRGINPDLQKLFEMEMGNEPEDEFIPPDNDQSSWWRMNRVISFLGPKVANASMKKSDWADILKWKVPKTDVADYVSKVDKLLEKSTIAVLNKNSKKIPSARQKMFRQLIPAMAWQESCYRQFVVKKSKLTYLLSYNQTSVGLMQVNERVWRGIYNMNRLRWDIHYNAIAGSEIAALYLTKYGLKDKEKAKNIDDDTLARLVYAMYNGGPSQYKKFFQRMKNKKYYKSDDLFWEKFNLVKSGKVNQVSVCLIGR